MANSNKGEPNTAPQPDRWYNLNLGNSFKDHRPSSKFCTLRYEFKPASIDKKQKGTLQKKDNKVTVEFRNNQQGKPNVTFEGSSEDYKPNEAVLFFDGTSFRLERLHRAVKQLRHVRLPGESASSAAAAGGGGSLAEGAVSPPVGKPTKAAYNRTPIPAIPVEVERIDIGGYRSPDAKHRNEKVVEYPPVYENPLDVPPVYENALDSPDNRMDDLEEQLDIMIDDDDDDAEMASGGNIEVKEFHSGMGIDINAPHHDMDDEIAVDAIDDEADMVNAAEALKAKINAEVEQSSSSSSSGSESSSSSSSSSSDSENSDADSLTSI